VIVGFGNAHTSASGFVADIEPLVNRPDAGLQPGVERGGYRHDDALT
jgi:hypothetical protein